MYRTRTGCGFGHSRYGDSAGVSVSVRHSHGREILIPPGARLIGTYDHHVTRGQRRAMVSWHGLRFPNGASLDSGTMSGTDAEGSAGFKDKVERRHFRIFGVASLLSVIGTGV